MTVAELFGPIRPPFLDLPAAVDAMLAENDRLRGLLEEAWAWSSPAISSQSGYLDLARRINEALGGEPSGNL